MPKITFIHPDGTEQTVFAPENWSIMQIAIEHKIKGIDGVCGGSMACATCHVYIPEEWQDPVTQEDNEQSEEERDMLETAPHLRETSRLGCQIVVTKNLDGLIVNIPAL